MSTNSSKYFGRLRAETVYNEMPDENDYVVQFVDEHGALACTVHAVVYIPNFTLKRVNVQRDLTLTEGIEDVDLLEAAEIEMNKLPGLDLYVPLSDFYENQELVSHTARPVTKF
jgi:hypothetical protein